MADTDLRLRSDVEKGETSPDDDLRLRSDAEKTADDDVLQAQTWV